MGDVLQLPTHLDAVLPDGQHHDSELLLISVGALVLRVLHGGLQDGEEGGGPDQTQLPQVLVQEQVAQLDEEGEVLQPFSIQYYIREAE